MGGDGCVYRHDTEPLIHTYPVTLETPRDGENGDGDDFPFFSSDFSPLGGGGGGDGDWDWDWDSRFGNLGGKGYGGNTRDSRW